MRALLLLLSACLACGEIDNPKDASSKADDGDAIAVPVGTSTQVPSAPPFVDRLSGLETGICGLLTAGFNNQNVMCWKKGFGGYYAPAQVEKLSRREECGIKANGELTCWNDAVISPGPFGQVSATFVKNTASLPHLEYKMLACGVRSDGVGWCNRVISGIPTTPLRAIGIWYAEPSTLELVTLDTVGHIRRVTHDVQVAVADLPGTFVAIGRTTLLRNDGVWLQRDGVTPVLPTQAKRIVKISAQDGCGLYEDGIAVCVRDGKASSPSNQRYLDIATVGTDPATGCGLLASGQLECWGGIGNVWEGQTFGP